MIGANQPGGVTKPTRQTNGALAAQTNDPVEKEYQKLVEDDDAAEAEVDKWIEENNRFAAKGAGVPAADLNQRIQQKFDPIRKRYEDFIQRHPNHARVRVAAPARWQAGVGGAFVAVTEWRHGRGRRARARREREHQAQSTALHGQATDRSA